MACAAAGNGIGAGLELLQPFVDALDPRREVIRFDMPGAGGSPAPVVPYHLWTLAPLLRGLLDQLGHQQADVLGMSWGDGLAQQFAVRCPSRVRRLVLVATSPGALMVPGHPRVLLHMLAPGATAVMVMRPASPVNFTAAACATIPRSPANCCTPPHAPSRPGATTTSSWPPPAGRACRCCRGCASPP